MDVDAPKAGTADLYDEHSRALYAYALSLTGDAVLSEDIVHDAFVRLIESDRDVASVGPFLFTVVRNLVFDSRRRRARSRELPLPLSPSPTRPDDGLADAASRALGRLPEEQREAVVLKIYGGLTFAAIGELTGTTTATAASRYRLALEKMAASLSKETSP